MPRYLRYPEEYREVDFETKYKKEINAKLKIRYLALYYLSIGKTSTEIAELLSITTKVIGMWVNKLKTEGVEGLKDKAKPGRTRVFDKNRLDEFKQDVIKMQKDKTDGRIIASDIQKHLLEKYGIKYSKSSVYNLLRLANLVWITGRSSHPNRDLAKQEEFKKNLLQ